MKLGLVVECGPAGPEAQVLPYLAQEVVQDIEVEQPVTMSSKPNLLANCGQAIAHLLEGGCEKVFVVWDLYPAWRTDGGPPDCGRDCEAIRESLRAAGIADGDGRIVLICIREELEAWLVADGRALSSVLSRLTHLVSVKDEKSPDTVHNPKARLRKLFQEHGRHDYCDRTDAIKIARGLPDRNRIRRSQSFARFESRLTT